MSPTIRFRHASGIPVVTQQHRPQVLALAGELGVPALVVAGEVFDTDPVAALAAELTSAPVTVVSLVEHFGEERARRDTRACVEASVAALLRGSGVAP